MIEDLSGIITYLIAAALLTVALFVMKRKNAEQPNFKVLGLSIQAIVALIYIGIAINLILIFASIMGWMKN